ncbi:hypothetical protein TNCV_4744021 [Trichonephila clavipes]|nr:hypothetical protein TNCV_4744021 [Trichonephila clavipes]
MSPQSIIGIVCKTTSVCTNNSTTFAVAWNLSSEIMAMATLDAASQTEASSMMKNVRLLPWPARSPDLSPIESAKRLARHHIPVTTVDKLWYHVEAAWSSAPVHAMQSRHDSMPRLDLVLNVRKRDLSPTALHAIALETINIRFPPEEWLHIYTDGSLLDFVQGAGIGVFSHLFFYLHAGPLTTHFDGEVEAIHIALQQLAVRLPPH